MVVVVDGMNRDDNCINTPSGTILSDHIVVLQVRVLGSSLQFPAFDEQRLEPTVPAHELVGDLAGRLNVTHFDCRIHSCAQCVFERMEFHSEQRPRECCIARHRTCPEFALFLAGNLHFWVHLLQHLLDVLDAYWARASGPNHQEPCAVRDFGALRAETGTRRDVARVDDGVHVRRECVSLNKAGHTVLPDLELRPAHDRSHHVLLHTRTFQICMVKYEWQGRKC